MDDKKRGGKGRGKKKAEVEVRRESEEVKRGEVGEQRWRGWRERVGAEKVG